MSSLKRSGRWSRIYRKVIIFFSRPNTKEVMTFLVFLFLSASFWLLQNVYEETDGSFEVTFVVRNMPDNAVFTTAVPSELKVTVKDKNIALVRYYLSNSLNTFEIDFSRYADEEGNFRVSATELRNLIQDQLESGSQVIAITPAFIDARFAMTKGKRIPVKFSGDYIARVQYRCQEVKLTPDSVLAYAPEPILDTLSAIYTENRLYRDLTSTVKENLPLVLPIAVKTDPQSVRLDIVVEEYTEKAIGGIPVEIIDLPDTLSLKVFPQMIVIRCNVSIHQYKQLTADKFRLQVSYRDILDEKQKRLPVRVVEASPMASYIHLYPDSVEYIIEENNYNYLSSDSIVPRLSADSIVTDSLSGNNLCRPSDHPDSTLLFLSP